MDFIKRTFPLLFGIFFLSVVVRLPQLNRPLSKHHEFCTAISLRIMQIWYDNGISKYNYNPVMSFNNDADKFINNSANASGKMIDKEGNFYYVSHPPFAYYFPFFLFKLLHIRPDVLPLQILNLVFHFISGLFVYFTVCLLSFTRARNLPYRPAVVAFVIYTFLPVTLWFQGNVYMSDMAVHLLFILGVYSALKMIIRQKFYSVKYIFFYSLVLALMIYTSWLGVFFACGVLIYSLLHVRDIKGFKILIWSTILISLIMLRFISYQYSQINGMGAYLSEMINRYLLRGSLAETNEGVFHFMFSYLWLLKTLLYNYVVHYNVVYLIILLFLWLTLRSRKMKIVFTPNGYRFIWLSIVPVLLMHAFFLNYSVHDFSVLYASLFFSVLLGILYDKVKKSGVISLRKMQVGLVAVVILMVAEYQLMNPPDFLKPDGIAEHQKIGKQIQGAAAKDEVCFLLNAKAEPQLIYYAQRNIRRVESRDEALGFLQSRGISQGIIFEAKDGKLSQERISMNP